MLSVYRARLHTPPSPALQVAYAAAGKLSGVAVRHENGNVAVKFDEEARQKMRAIIAMELQEADSLGVRIVLPQSPHVSVFRTFLDKVWGIDEPDSQTRSPSTIFTVRVPYHEGYFDTLTVPAEISVC